MCINEDASYTLSQMLAASVEAQRIGPAKPPPAPPPAYYGPPVTCDHWYSRTNVRCDITRPHSYQHHATGQTWTEDSLYDGDNGDQP